MKPNTTQAMQMLLDRIRAEIPLDWGEAEICRDDCRSCSLKLIEFMRSEVEHWQAKIDQGERIGLAELSQLAKTARKVQRALSKNGLIQSG